MEMGEKRGKSLVGDGSSVVLVRPPTGWMPRGRRLHGTRGSPSLSGVCVARFARWEAVTRAESEPLL